MTLEERLWKTFNKALGKYQLIDEDDHILVGLSGGKDSLCLLEFLARRSKIHVPRFTVEALHVRMENIQYETDTTYLQSFCDRLGIPFHIIYDERDIFPLTTHSFEGVELSVPGNADHMLRSQFGNYMELPNLEKVGGDHVVKLEFRPASSPSR